MNFIDKIQSKPKRIRKYYMWLAIGLSMVLVVVIWLINFPKYIKPQNAQEQDSSFQDLKTNIQDFKEQIQDIKEEIELDEFPEDDLEVKSKPMKLPLE